MDSRGRGDVGEVDRVSWRQRGRCPAAGTAALSIDDRESAAFHYCPRGWQARLLRQRLRRLIGFESPEELLFALGLGGLSQAAVAEHQIVVRLQIFGIDRERLLRSADGVGVAALQELNAAESG